MPLTTEAIEGGLFTVTPRTRQFFADYSAALFAKDFTPIEDRPGATEAIEELKDLFADGFSCQEFKDRLHDLGMFGCGRSRRLKAIAALLGLTDEEVKDCLEEKREEPGPQMYYLPPEPGLIQRASLPEPTDDDADVCTQPGLTRITTADDALCPTDTGKGCAEPDGEDTDDLPDLEDCEEASTMLRGIGDLFPILPPGALIDRTDQEGVIIEASGPPQGDIIFPTPEEEDQVQEILPSLSPAFPLYTSRTYLDALYTAINIHDHPKFKGCDTVQAQSEELIENINNVIISLPRGYINPNLLPPGFDFPDVTVKQQPPKINAGLSTDAGQAARRSARSARRYAARHNGA